jgi:peptide/nickel transport system substrate-binding protein
MRVAFASVLAVLLGTGCSQELGAPAAAAGTDAATPRAGGVLQLSSFADIRTVDPANIADGLVTEINQALFAGLVDYDQKGEIVPDLAERMDIDAQGRVYRFALRAGVRFHDGELLDAADVVRSIERALGPDSPNPSSSLYSSILGFEAFTEGKAAHLQGVTQDGPLAVTITLKEADSTFLPALALHPLRPVCRSMGAKYADGAAPCGAGPFRLPPGGWDKGRKLSLERHPGYFRPGLPHLDGITWTFHVNLITERFKLERGEIDLLREFTQPDLLRFQQDPRWRPFGAYEAEKQVLGESLNTELPPFDNIEVRRAVAAAINREHIRLVQPARIRPAGRLIPPGIPGAATNVKEQTYDLAAALEHMRKAGYPFDPTTKTGGYPEPIPYVVYRQGLAEYTAQIVQSELAQIGLRLDLRIVNYPTYLALAGRRGKTAMTNYGWQQDYPAPASFLEPLFHSKSITAESSNNTAFYKSARYDDVLDRAKREVDGQKRNALYGEAEQILVDDAPWAFTHFFRWYEVHQPYVRGYTPHPVWAHNVSFAWLDRPATTQRAAASAFLRGLGAQAAPRHP